MKSALAALAFLTRLPVGRFVEFSASDVSRSAGWFPVSGALLGSIYALSARLLLPHLPVMVVAVILVTLDAVLTGALHLDGLADTADGFGGGRTRDDVLRIMRDHAIGSYGGVALALLIALKVAAYNALFQREGWVAAVIVTPVLGRWSMLLLVRGLPYARETASVIQGIGNAALLLGTLATAAVLFAVRTPSAWAAACAAIVVTSLFGLYCRRRIAGITGDTLGAGLELCESVVLLAFLWTI
jgi:adenosylcobinamide-GDP ribazoletransferase